MLGITEKSEWSLMDSHEQNGFTDSEHKLCVIQNKVYSFLRNSNHSIWFANPFIFLIMSSMTCLMILKQIKSVFS